MNIFYCCGVMEAQKKIWWKNFLHTYSTTHSLTVSKRYSEAVTHIVCGRVSATVADIRHSIGVEVEVEALLSKGVKIVSSSWMMECVKAKKRVSECEYVLPTLQQRDIIDDHTSINMSSSNHTTKDQTSLSSSSSKRTLKEFSSHSPDESSRKKRDARVRARVTCVPLHDDGTCTLNETFLRPPPAILKIGSLSVGAYGIGTLAWGVVYPDPAARPSEEEVCQLLHAGTAATHPNTVLVDTADSYCTNNHDFGYMESLLGKLISSNNDELSMKPLVATKGGMMRTGSESNSWREASYSTPEAWEACIRSSLKRLRCDANNPLPLWQVHHCKPNNLIAAMTACQKLLAENLILHIGLCNVTVADIELCQQLVPVASVQNSYSLWDRTAERPLTTSSNRSSTSKRGVLKYCSDNSIPFLAYGALGGLATRRGEDRWCEYPQLLALADRKGVSVTSLVLSMMRHRFPCLLPLVGSRRLEHVKMLRQAYEVRLTRSELNEFPSLT
jgi:pyridoxine 4-dehydrogenase